VNVSSRTCRRGALLITKLADKEIIISCEFLALWRYVLKKKTCLITLELDKSDNLTIVIVKDNVSAAAAAVFVFRIIRTLLICMARARRNGTRCLKFSGHFRVYNI
jgi:hypothetical protein